MDSYRPGRPLDERDGSDRRRDDGSRNYQQPIDYDRYDDRTRGYDQSRRRGSRDHDSQYQQYAQEGSYRDLDRGDRRGRKHYASRPRMDYDDDSNGRGDRNRFDPQRIVSRDNFNYSDILRYGAEHAPAPNTGEKDIADKDDQTRYLLIRDLKPSLSEELLAKGLEKLYRGADEHASGATPLSLRSVMIIKKRGTDESMGYAFAEFHTVKDAMAARVKSLRNDHQFTVASQRYRTDFAHSGVFPPASIPGKYGPTEEEFTFIMTSTGRAHKYHDERYFAKPYLVNQNPPETAHDLGEASTNTGGNVQTGSKRGIDTSEIQPKSKKAKKAAGQPVIPELQKWQTKQTELRGETGPADTISKPQTSDVQTFAIDTNELKRCFLCGSKFTTSETLMKHLQASPTHLRNLEDDELIRHAYERLEKKQIDPATTVKLPASQTPAISTSAPAPGEPPGSQQWRDRAAERRQVESAAPAHKIGFSLKQQGSGPAKSRPSSSGSDSAKPTLAKGRGMLQKAGWSEGQGLGDGSGISAPIETMAYAAGVGLGHEGSLRGDAIAEAEKRTKGSGGGGDFLEQTRENARKRFEGM